MRELGNIIPFTNEEVTIFIYIWVSFGVLVMVGGLGRLFYNYDKNKIKITKYQILKIYLYAFFVCFLAKNMLLLFKKEEWEIVAIPITAFISEVVVTSIAENDKSIISSILNKFGISVSKKIDSKLNKKSNEKYDEEE